jgi:hypothetical protein
LYWKRATAQGGLVSIAFRCCGVDRLELLAPEGFWPPQLAGLLASISGMVLGSLMPQWVSHHAKV